MLKTARKTRTGHSKFKGSGKPEARRKELVAHLGIAMQLEHATIPPYLCALYSIRDPDVENPEAARVLRSVVVEEMLHMTLVANLLNAIQKGPRYRGLDIDRPGFVPTYPAFLPNSDQAFKVHLRRFSPEAIENFLQIEQPASEDAEPKHDDYSSIGQFYSAIKDELEDFCREYGEDALFIGDRARQVGPEFYYNGGGEVFEVTDYASAHRAIKVITDEGEGFNQTIFSGDHEQFGERRDPAHYYKFSQVLFGRYYRSDDSPERPPTGLRFPVAYGPDAVYPVRFDLPLDRYPDDVRRASEDFDRTYWALLRACRRAYSGTPAALRDAVALMYDVKYRMVALMRTPLGDGRYTAGPKFLHPDADDDGRAAGTRTRRKRKG